MKVIYEHIKFIREKLVEICILPDIRDQKFLDKFNYGFGNAYRAVMLEEELFDLEDAYTSALISMFDFDEESTDVRRLTTIIRYRLRVLSEVELSNEI